MVPLAKFLIAVAGASFTTLGAGSTAQAAIIGSGTLSDSGGIRDILTRPTFLVEIVELDDQGFEQSPGTPLFSHRLTQSDVGNPFKVTPGNTSNFAQIETLLANGANDLISFGISGNRGLGSAVGGFESSFTFNDGTDFKGFDLKRLTVTVDSLQVASPGSDPNGDGIWSDYSADYSLKVSAKPVPEPSTALGTLVAAIGFGVLLLRKKVTKGQGKFAPNKGSSNP